MWPYLLKRLALMVPTLLGVLTLSFVVTQFVPGGPIDHALARLYSEGARSDATGEGSAESGSLWAYTGRQGIDEEQVAELTALYGFDRPLHERYLHMLSGYLRFDLGESYFHHQSVWSLIVSKLPVSLSLGTWILFLTYLISLPLGVSKALRSGTPFDTATTVLLLVGYALPSFVLGVLLIVLFGGGSTFWEIFPLRGLTSDNWDELATLPKLLDYLWHIAMPVTAMVVSSFALKSLLTRNLFLDEMDKQYVLTARAKGVPERRILWKHIFRNALLPLITGFPPTFIAAFFTSTLLIETLFSLDGLGLLSYESIQTRDYPVVLGTLYVFTLIGLVTKLAGDVAYVVADPRIKYEAGAH
ncbi:microcin C ABC transporter permease YejB [Steroidobacter sp.]|uniref:microcin C ABC transporter permease YejB n=1 Tax=Steroidobacter sp. TaxID=1978227 RepID=UPI001A592C2A|nr:ABC transporter permease subunit [Steroidobacter sp.]MBL8267387.1 ABC transporter permease subunit [Steroidobacter sp.]